MTFPDGYAGTVSGGTLRVWDPASAATARFARIARFERSDEWVASGRYTPIDGLEERGSVVDAAGDPLAVAGHIETAFGSTTVRLVAVRSAPFQGSARLQLVVQDATSALLEDDPAARTRWGASCTSTTPVPPSTSSSTGTCSSCRRARSRTSSRARSHRRRTGSRRRSPRGAPSARHRRTRLPLTPAAVSGVPGAQAA
ncbi:hypothetical protein P9139_12975 [Curtobacterium flaccumfaciens]|nr:hypothetical protein P9139_12975 [Curtobacterium flaccumfaciens]